jgi:hypothetical protein
LPRQTGPRSTSGEALTCFLRSEVLTAKSFAASIHHMALVTVDNLAPGMEAAEDVLNVNGLLLLPKGSILSDRHIRMLKMWGVEILRVGEEPGAVQAPAAETAVGPESAAAAERRIADRFRHVDDALPAARLVRQLAREHLARRLAAQAKLSPGPT